MSATEDIQGLRVIVVEDDSLICLLIEDMLSDLGCKVVGAAGDFKKAIELAQREEGIDVAILDVNLGGQLVFPVADILSNRGIPFLFATGMGAFKVGDCLPSRTPPSQNQDLFQFLYIPAA